MCFNLIASNRVVININGLEDKPSNLWEFTQNEKSRWRFYNSPYDKSYKLSIPVIISKGTEDLTIYCPKPWKMSRIIKVKNLKYNTLCSEMESQSRHINLAMT